MLSSKMNLIEDIVVYNLGKYTSFNPLNWIDSFQIDKNVTDISRRKNDIVNITKSELTLSIIRSNNLISYFYCKCFTQCTEKR